MKTLTIEINCSLDGKERRKTFTYSDDSKLDTEMLYKHLIQEVEAVIATIKHTTDFPIKDE